MGTTQYYGLSFFDFGDSLDSPLNVQKEIDRFVIVDKQLYGLYNVFGNGVLDGWTVRDGGFTEGEGIAISISQGMGIINFMAAETHITSFLYGLTPNSVIDIYATITGTTVRDRQVEFIADTNDLSSNSVIRLARLATGNNSILYIDNTMRDLVSFDEIIEDQINQHRHRGTPSKIDLQEETKNQLPGSRIESIDASKITSGQFDVDRIPITDHNDLENNGMLTHAALDSFVQTLSQNNKELLGEIAGVNLLKTVLFLKYNYPTVDEHFINELAIIPGISPDRFIDFNSSTANINLINNCISGYPAQTGIFTSVYWNTSYTFDNAYVKDDVVISNNEVSLERTGSNIDTITDFSNNVCFEPEMITSNNNMECEIVEEQQNKMGRLGGGATLTYYYRSNLSESKNWDGQYDELVINVKTVENVHSPVYMYVVNGSNLTSDGTSYGSIEDGNIEGVKKPLAPWILLESNEVTSGFEEKVFDISDLGLNDVTQITIYTRDSFTFDIDDIHARRTNLVADDGTIRFRYQTEANVVFHSIFYDAETPDGTSLSVRVKTASSTDLLSRAAYSLPLDSGDVFALTGRAAEIEVTMNTDNTNTLTPVLNSLELRILTDADFNGFVIDNETEWNRGTLSNVSVNDVAGQDIDYLSLSTPINIGGRSFAKSNSISEINDSNIGVFGFNGINMPIAPNQARNWGASSARGFDRVSSAIRKYNKNYLIADMNNNRVLEVNSSGNLVKGFGSTYTIDTNFYPLSAVYNPSTQVLTIVFTKAAVVSDITQISFYINNVELSLTANETVLTERKGGGKILEIELDDDTALNLSGVTSNLSVNFGNGAFADTISMNSGMSVVGNSIFSQTRGLICFVGEFYYIDNIRHPVFVNETEKENWIIANSSIFYGEIDTTKEEDVSVPDIIEINPSDLTDTDNKLSFTNIRFSDYSLGGIYEYSEDRFMVAGIDASSSTIDGITSDGLLAKYEEPYSESVLFRASAIDDLAGFAGKVMMIDKDNGRSAVFYTCPDGVYASDIDGYSNGDYLISESSFADASGRLVRLDQYGNVTWNYGMGTFNVINDAKVLNDDNIIVSV